MEPTSHTNFADTVTRRQEPQTLAELLFFLQNPDKRRELEEYRIEYEAAYGPTDLTKRYTSVWPLREQEWLIKHDIKRYFDGLPSFAKAYFKGKLQMAAAEGRLDDQPDELLKLYVSGNMKLDGDSYMR